MKNAIGVWLGPGAALAMALTAGAAERVYFGDLHLHTRYSNDAWASAETRTPDDSYRSQPFAFAAFEWTSSTPDFGNLHRVVVFEGTEDLPHPYSWVDSIHPEDLWSYLETQRMRGVDAIAIPHNANVSNGHMFALTDSFGEPLNAHYAALLLRAGAGDSDPEMDAVRLGRDRRAPAGGRAHDPAGTGVHVADLVPAAAALAAPSGGQFPTLAGAVILYLPLLESIRVRFPKALTQATDA